MEHFNRLQLELPNGSKWQVSKAIIDVNGDLYKRALDQAKIKSLYTMSASQAGGARTPEMKLQRQLMGCLAEIYAQEYLKGALKNLQLDHRWEVIRYDDVRTDGFKSPANEYDLVIKGANKSFFVESRSSITRDRSIEKGIQDFDIIGPYISSAKSGESYSDIYIRPLYSYNDFAKGNYSDLNFQDGLIAGKIELYLVAGCLKEDMVSKGYNKSMMQGGTNYRVIKITHGNDVNIFQVRLAKILN